MCGTHMCLMDCYGNSQTVPFFLPWLRTVRQTQLTCQRAMPAVLIVQQHSWLHTMLQLWNQVEPQESQRTPSPSDIVFFSTRINESEALIHFIMVTKHHHTSDIVTWKPNNVHPLLASTQQVKPYPFTCQLQWMWHSRNCIGYHIHAFNTSLFIQDELQCNHPPTSSDSRNTLCHPSWIGFLSYKKIHSLLIIAHC